MKTYKEVKAIVISSEESTSAEDAPAQSSITTPPAPPLMTTHDDQPSSEETGDNVTSPNNVSPSQSTVNNHLNHSVFLCSCDDFTLMNSDLIHSLYTELYLSSTLLSSESMYNDFGDFEDEFSDDEDDSIDELINGFSNVTMDQPNQESGPKIEGSLFEPEDEDEDEFDFISLYQDLIGIVFESVDLEDDVIYDELPSDNPIKKKNENVVLEPLFSDLSSDEEANYSSDNSSDDTP